MAPRQFGYALNQSTRLWFSHHPGLNRAFRVHRQHELHRDSVVKIKVLVEYLNDELYWGRVVVFDDDRYCATEPRVRFKEPRLEAKWRERFRSCKELFDP